MFGLGGILCGQYRLLLESIYLILIMTDKISITITLILRLWVFLLKICLTRGVRHALKSRTAWKNPTTPSLLACNDRTTKRIDKMGGRALLAKRIGNTSSKDICCISLSLHSRRCCTLVPKQSASLSYKGEWACTNSSYAY